MAHFILITMLVVFLSPASPSIGLAEQQEIFSLNAPKEEGKGNSGFSLVGNPQLVNAPITDIRLSRAGLKLHSGFPVLGYDYDKVANIAIAVGNGVKDVSLTSVKNLSGNGLELVASFRKNHKPVTPLKEQIAVFDLTTFKRLDWSFRKNALSQKGLAVYLLADVSVSMKQVFDTVKSSAKDFFLAMPKGVSCSLSSFDAQLYRVSKQPENCKVAAKRIDTMMLHGGSTDLYGALSETYEQAAQDGFSHQLIILITDGHHVGSGTEEDTLRTKRLVNGKTIVLWLGNFGKEDLAKIADIESSVGQHVQEDIQTHFKNLKLFVKGQRYLHVKR